MCAFKFSVFCDESSKKITLLGVLAGCIAKKFMHLKRFCEQCKTIEAASKSKIKEIKKYYTNQIINLVPFSSILQQLQYFESGIQLIDAEIQQSGQNQVLSNFLSYCESEVTQLKELIQVAKVNFIIFFILLKFFYTNNF